MIDPELLQGPFNFKTFDGRLPIVMIRKNPHGEADTFYTSIFGTNGMRVVELDFGYGNKRDEQLAHLFCASFDLLQALQALGAQGEPGYCFCRTQEQADNGHTGECNQANAAISKALNTKGN